MNAELDLFSDIRTDGTSISLSIPRLHLALQPHQAELLKQPCPHFLTCETVHPFESYITYTYEKSEKHLDFSLIKDCTLTEKYLILLNIGKIFSDTKRRYSTSFDPRNILISHTFDTVFIFRTLPDTQLYRTFHEEFEEYRALVLSVLQSQYSFHQLLQYGPDIVGKKTLCAEIVDAQTPQELEALLTAAYTKKYLDARHNRKGFSTKFVNLYSLIMSFLLVSLTITLGYFIYNNLTETREYGTKMYIYENYYNRNPQAVINYANKLSDQDMDTNLRRIVADALIATNQKDNPDNLKRAFSLDPARQIEIIEILIAQENTDVIASLSSDNHLAQLYQAYYAKDYQKAITLAENNTDLRLNAQAQILLAKVYVALKDYTQAETILSALGDPDALLETYQQHREAVVNNETDIEKRKQLLTQIDDVIRLLEEVKSKTAQDASQSS